MMAPVFLLLLAAVSVFAGPERKDLVDDGDYSDGGVSADMEDFPFIVSLQYFEKKEVVLVSHGRCGGTIIAEEWVLTAAFCLDIGTELIELTHVRAGSSHNDRGGVLRAITKKVSHEYPPHDIALIKVHEPWPFNGATISLARLPRQDDPIPVLSRATIMGWGFIDDHIMEPDILTRKEVRVISFHDCDDSVRTWSGDHPTITDRHICTMNDIWQNPAFIYLVGLLDTKFPEGDPGNPVVANGEVVGIVSIGDSVPLISINVHTRVSSYIDWIEDTVGPLPSTAQV